MTTMGVFALIVLVVVLLIAIGIAVALAMMPDRIPQQRGHPQAEAIAVCGWWGLLTAGLLLSSAWLWAYANPESTRQRFRRAVGATQPSTNCAVISRTCTTMFHPRFFAIWMRWPLLQSLQAEIEASLHSPHSTSGET